MAEENSKITIELDLENKSFNTKMNESKSMFGSLEHAATGAFDKTLFGVVSVNQGLEIAEKMLQAFESALQKIEFAESFKNQETALRNLTKNIGVDAEKLTEVVKKASGGTITSLEATQTAFKLLQSGIKAENIPAIVEFADKMEESSGGVHKFNDVINAMSSAVGVGAVRGLKEFDLKVSATGDRMQIQNAIIEQMKMKVESLGEGFDQTGKKITTRMADAANSWKTSFGEGLTAIIQKTGLFSTETEKSAQKLESLTSQLNAVKFAAFEGQKQFDMWNKEKGVTEWVDAATKQKALQAEIAALSGKIAEETHKEAEENHKNNEALVQKKDVEKVLTASQAQKVDLLARTIALQNLANKETASGDLVSIKNSQELVKAKQALLETTFNDQKTALMETETSEARLKEKLVILEQQKYEKIRALRVQDDDFKLAKDNAQIVFLENHLLSQENAQKRITDLRIASEDEFYNKQLELLRNSGLTKEQFNMEVEQKEQQHQARITDIKQRAEAVNMNNLKAGVGAALTQLNSQYGNFSKFTETMTTKAHGIISNSFVKMAKDHKLSMEEMTGSFLEMIGTELINRGVLHLMDGAAKAFVGDPGGAAEAGQGAAMIGAGMALVGASGGGAGSSAGGAGAGGGATGATPAQSPTLSAKEQGPSKQASIVINGDFLNSRETANHLSEIIRQNSDITDYSITAQGRNYG